MDIGTALRAGARTGRCPGRRIRVPAAPGRGPALCGVSRRRPHPAAPLPRGRQACGDANSVAAMAAASAIELLHCASLVHDDLPCFDNSACGAANPPYMRIWRAHRGSRRRRADRAGLRMAGGPARAVADRLAPLTRIVASCVGGPSGICAGQAWECEDNDRHRELPARQDRSAFRGLHHGGRCRSRAMSRRPGRRWAMPSARPSRWRTTCATSRARRRTWASPLARTPPISARTSLQNLASTAPCGASRIMLAAALAAIPPCPGAEQLGLQITAVSRSLVTGLSARQAA